MKFLKKYWLHTAGGSNGINGIDFYGIRVWASRFGGYNKIDILHIGKAGICLLAGCVRKSKWCIKQIYFKM